MQFITRFITIVCFGILLGSSLLNAGEPEKQQQTLYQRLGGYDAIAAVTDDFIGRMAADPQLNRFFVGHSEGSLKKVRQLVVDQLCEATGGPCYYTGRDMKSAHAGMGISETDWDAAVKHLVATLEKFQVPQREKDEVLGAVSSFKADIVAKPTETTHAHDRDMK